MSSLSSTPVLGQLEQSEAKCEDALKTQKVLTADLENMHSELENMTRSKSLVLSPHSSRSTGCVFMELKRLGWLYGAPP